MSVSLSVGCGAAVITIDRPERRNAIDRPSAQAIADALDELDRREDITVGVLTGAGGTFSAGMDLKALTETGERPVIESRGAFGIVERPPEKPLIAAVEGYALGGGFEIALACDMIIAAETAIFGLPEVRRGLVAAAGGVIRLPQRIPFAYAMEYALTGVTLPATRAVELGLVNRITPEGGALEAARELALQIAANAPLAVRASMQIVRRAQGASFADAFAAQQAPLQRVRESDDAQEGARAFVEKRKPQWTGT
jgi:enoyl-CoA hydratase/carnithine racemase